METEYSAHYLMCAHLGAQKHGLVRWAAMVCCVPVVPGYRADDATTSINLRLCGVLIAINPQENQAAEWMFNWTPMHALERHEDRYSA